MQTSWNIKEIPSKKRMNKLKMGTLQQVKEEIVVCSKWVYLICTLKGPIFKCSNVRNDYKLKSEIKIKNPQVQWIIIIIIVIIFNICDSSPNTLSPVKSDHRLTNIYCIITFNKQTNKQTKYMYPDPNPFPFLPFSLVERLSLQAPLPQCSSESFLPSLKRFRVIGKIKWGELSHASEFTIWPSLRNSVQEMGWGNSQVYAPHLRSKFGGSWPPPLFIYLFILWVCCLRHAHSIDHGWLQVFVFFFPEARGGGGIHVYIRRIRIHIYILQHQMKRLKGLHSSYTGINGDFNEQFGGGIVFFLPEKVS